MYKAIKESQEKKRKLRLYKTKVVDYPIERVPHPTLKNTWIERKKTNLIVNQLYICNVAGHYINNNFIAPIFKVKGPATLLIWGFFYLI